MQLESYCHATAAIARSGLDQSCFHHASGGASGSGILPNRDIPSGDGPEPRQLAVLGVLTGWEKQARVYQLAFSWTPIWLSRSRSPNTPR